MLPELHDFTKRKIFSSTEVRAIIKKRRNFEYNVRRKQIYKVDFLRYAEYETRLDLLRRKRKKRQGVKKNSVSDFSGVKRIHGIYTRALQRFKNDVSLWSQYIMFCKHSGADRLLGRVYASAVQHNPLCVELWVDAATWEFEQNGSDQSARALMQRAIRLNDQARPLWKEYLRFELLCAVKMRERGNLLGTNNDVDGPLSDEATEEQAAQKAAHQAFIDGAIAQVLLDSIFEQFSKDWTFILELATLIQSFPGFPGLLQSVYDKFGTLDCASEPKCQVALLAQMHRNGSAEGDALYLEALRAEVAQSPASTELWTALFAFLHEVADPVPLLAAYAEADEAGAVGPDEYCAWGQTLVMCAQFGEAVEMLEAAVEAHPASSALACGLVSAIAAASLAGKTDFPVDQIVEVLRSAIDQCSSAEQPGLWQALLQATAVLPASSEQVHHVFKAALLAAPTDDWLKQTYLLWAAGRRDATQVRAVIQQLLSMPQLTEQQVLRCARFEQLQPAPDTHAVRRVFERGVQALGESKSLWEEYIAHEQSSGDLAAMATLQRRATKCGHNMS